VWEKNILNKRREEKSEHTVRRIHCHSKPCVSDLIKQKKNYSAKSDTLWQFILLHIQHRNRSLNKYLPYKYPHYSFKGTPKNIPWRWEILVTKDSLRVVRTRINTVIAESLRDHQWPRSLVFQLILDKKVPRSAMFLYTLCFPHVQATAYAYARKHGRHVRSKQITTASFKIPFKWALCLKRLGDKKIFLLVPRDYFCMIRNPDRYETRSHLTTLWKPRAEGNKILTTLIHITRCRKCKWVAAPECMSLFQGALCSWMLMAWRPFMWPCSSLQVVVESEKGKRLSKLATEHFRSAGVVLFNFKHKQFPYTHLSIRLRSASLWFTNCATSIFPPTKPSE
jgi:hypothetical protein